MAISQSTKTTGPPPSGDGGELLDTLPEELFDGIVALTAQALRVPYAFFSIIDGDRIWFKSRYGINADQIDARGSFCAETARLGRPLIVPDATADPRFAERAIVGGPPHVRFYAGVPVRTSSGRCRGTLCVLDLEPREFAEADLRLLEGFAAEIAARVALRAARELEQQLLDERVILMNMILHDARGVLASLTWSLEALARQSSPPPEALLHSQHAVDELGRLCGSLSGLGNAEPTRIKVELRPEDVQRWFELLGRRATRLARESELTLVIDSQLPAGELWLDVHVMDRVLMNLIRNACAACAQEQGSSILLGARVEGDGTLCFTVSDDGPGIQEEIRDRIFDPYFTADAGARNGTGLGLAFVRLAARELGGSIEFRPREPRGSEFVFRVPVGAEPLNSAA